MCGLQAVRLWDIPGRKELWAFTSESEWFHHAIFSKGEKECFVATGSNRYTGPGRVVRLGVKGGKEVDSIQYPAAQVCYLAVSPDGTRIAGVRGWGVSVWDVASGKDVFNLPQLGAAGFAVEFSADGKLILTNGDLIGGNKSQGLGVWDAKTGKSVGEIHDKVNLVGLAVAGDGTVLTGAHSDGIVRVWKVRPR